MFTLKNKRINNLAQYGLNNVPSMDNLKYGEHKAYQGSLSHTGSDGHICEVAGSAGPVSGTGANVQDPGGMTKIQMGTAHPAHLGSQSSVPSKLFDADDNITPSKDYSFSRGNTM